MEAVQGVSGRGAAKEVAIAGGLFVAVARGVDGGALSGEERVVGRGLFSPGDDEFGQGNCGEGDGGEV